MVNRRLDVKLDIKIFLLFKSINGGDRNAIKCRYVTGKEGVENPTRSFFSACHFMG